MTIRAEKPGDVAAIRALNSAAFGRKDEAELVDHLRENGDFVLSLVAVEADEVVGHALFTKLLAPAGSLALAPVAVLPDFQSRGLGSALIREGLRRAEDEGWLRIFVVGEPAFYRRFGFSESMAARFRSPYAGSYSMGLDLNPATARAGDGEVIYPAPFGSLPPEG